MKHHVLFVWHSWLCKRTGGGYSCKHAEDVQLNGSEIIDAIKPWLRMVEVNLADEKENAVCIINRRKNKQHNTR